MLTKINLSNQQPWSSDYNNCCKKPATIIDEYCNKKKLEKTQDLFSLYQNRITW